MGQSFVRGLVGSQQPHSLSVIEHNAQNARECEDLGVTVFASLARFTEQVSETVDVCVLAVKPHDVIDVAQLVHQTFSEPCVVISIAAGVSLCTLQEHLSGFPLVRAMPNIAASQLLSATAMCAVGVSEQNEARAREVLETLGTVIRVNESDMNLVTAVSGSGPAYFFLLAEYIASVAQENGLDVDIAHQLVLQTFIGAAALAEGNGSFQLLREQVTSPGGTTQAAVESFQNNGLEEVIRQGIQAAVVRGREMDEASSEDEDVSL